MASGSGNDSSGYSRSIAGVAAVIVALIGLLSSPVWGPAICTGAGPCRPHLGVPSPPPDASAAAAVRPRTETTTPSPAATVGTVTTASPPRIAGDYTGTFTRSGQTANAQMDIRITQVGAVLTGTTNESGTVYTNAGTVTPDGRFHIVESGNIDLFGSLLGPGHLGGTWGPSGASGRWDVVLVPTISGAYAGTFTPGPSPMRIQIDQTGSVLSGTTDESGTIFTDTGTIGTEGHVHIVERRSRSVDLFGSLVGPGHLAGTWGPNGSSGTWDVR
jgi:hypothetical protein